jgi:hypothetical protein
MFAAIAAELAVRNTAGPRTPKPSTQPRIAATVDSIRSGAQ